MDENNELTSTLIDKICSRYLDPQRQKKCRATLHYFAFRFPLLPPFRQIIYRKRHRQNEFEKMMMRELGNAFLY